MPSVNQLISFDGQTLFKVMEGETYTIGDTVDIQSPSGASSGVSPTTTFNSKRLVVGGMLYGAFSDAAGPTSDNFQYPLQRGDVVAVAAIASSAAKVTVNGVLVYTIAATAVAGVLGYFG